MLQHEDHEEFARCVGLTRYYRSRMEGVIDRTINSDNSTPESRKLNDVWGARCELAVALDTGKSWSGIDRGSSADVGENIEVKSTKYHKSGHMIARPQCHWERTGIRRNQISEYTYESILEQIPNTLEYMHKHVYAFVTQNRLENKVHIVGYMKGADVINQEYWQGDSWWVPQSVFTRNYGDLV
jgi:hypothetical protein|tara:strand:- start:498 stop:1049 length:552 start_codon:yes stop_codon:yes gene_type:complete